MSSPRSSKRRLVLAGLAGTAALAALAWYWQGLHAAAQRVPLSMAVPTQLASGAVFVARDERLFERQGLDVSLQPFLIGKDALQAVIDGKADLALVADTPFMFAAARGAPIATIATVFASRNTMAIVLREGGAAPGLKGKRIGTVLGTNAQYFLDRYLAAHGVAAAAVTIVNLKPDELAGALRSGQVDAVTVWHPTLAQIEREMATRVTVIYDPDIFIYRFVLAGRQDYLSSHPNQVRAAVAALAAAADAIRERPKAARGAIARAIGIEPDLLERAFNAGDFGITLDQTLLLSLGDQHRWAAQRGFIAQKEEPNYLDFVRQEALDAALPGANRIIR